MGTVLKLKVTLAIFDVFGVNRWNFDTIFLQSYERSVPQF